MILGKYLKAGDVVYFVDLEFAPMEVTPGVVIGGMEGFDKLSIAGKYYAQAIKEFPTRSECHADVVNGSKFYWTCRAEAIRDTIQQAIVENETRGSWLRDLAARHGVPDPGAKVGKLDPPKPYTFFGTTPVFLDSTIDHGVRVVDDPVRILAASVKDFREADKKILAGTVSGVRSMEYDAEMAEKS